MTGPSAEYRAAIERVELAEHMAELEAGVMATAARMAATKAAGASHSREARIATLQAEVARRNPDQLSRVVAMSDPKPGTPEAALLRAVLEKPAKFVADHPDTFTRVE